MSTTGSASSGTTLPNITINYNLPSPSGSVILFADYSTSRVGVNTYTPSHDLHVVGDARITGAIYDSSNDAGTSGQFLSSTASGTNWITAPSGADGDAWGVGGEDLTSNVARTGNVHIGSTGAAQQKLDVVGNAEIGNSGEEMFIGDVGIPGWATIAHKNSANNVKYALRQNGNGQTRINAATNQPITFSINNTERARLHLNGSFGLGVTNPTQKLHVVGGARITSVASTSGNATSDRVVTVDAGGNLRSVPASSFASGPSISHAGRINSAGTILGGSGFTVTKLGTGDYRINFSSTMANSNYVIQLTVASQAGSRNDAPIITYGSQSTTSFRVYIGDSDNGESDLFRFDSEFMFTVITQ